MHHHEMRPFMDRFGPGSIAIGVAILALILMFLSWRRRSRRDSVLSPVVDIPAERGTELADVEGFFVATTVHDKPFERLAVTGLKFRGRAHVTVNSTGVVIQIPGESPIFVAASSIVRVAPATWAIDRVVETDGLILLAWSVATASQTAATKTPSAGGSPTVVGPEPTTTIDSYFRIVDQTARDSLLGALERIAPALHDAQTTTEREV
jgi:hypothetical protein